MRIGSCQSTSSIHYSESPPTVNHRTRTCFYCSAQSRPVPSRSPASGKHHPPEPNRPSTVCGHGSVLREVDPHQGFLFFRRFTSSLCGLACGTSFRFAGPENPTQHRCQTDSPITTSAAKRHMFFFCHPYNHLSSTPVIETTWSFNWNDPGIEFS